MLENYKEIYEILSRIENLSRAQYDRLVYVYGENVVRSVIRKLLIENKNNILRLKEYVSILDFISDKTDIDTYDYYSLELDLIDAMGSEENTQLISEINIILIELETIFKMFGCDNSIVEGTTVPWVCDKVKYCLDKYGDHIMIVKMKKLYDDYIIKRNKLVEGNLKLVRKYAKEFYNSGNVSEYASLNEIVQYGNMGLIRAVEKYSFEKDTLFSTFASSYIKFYMIDGGRNLSHIVKFPEHFIDERNKLLRASDKLCQELGRIPTFQELSEYVGITVEKIEQLRVAFLEPFSLVELIDSTFDGEEIFFQELLPDKEIDVENEVMNKCLYDQFEQLMLNCLNDRERYILRNRYGFDGNMTYDMIGKKLGISHQAVSQIEGRAIKKLRKYPCVKGMISYLR